MTSRSSSKRQRRGTVTLLLFAFAVVFFMAPPGADAGRNSWGYLVNQSGIEISDGVQFSHGYFAREPDGSTLMAWSSDAGSSVKGRRLSTDGVWGPEETLFRNIPRFTGLFGLQIGADGTAILDFANGGISIRPPGGSFGTIEQGPGDPESSLSSELNFVISDDGTITASWSIDTLVSEPGTPRHPGTVTLVKRVYFTASRPPWGGFGQVRRITPDSGVAYGLQMVAGKDGEVVAAWTRGATSYQDAVLEAASRPPDGKFSAPQALTAPGQAAASPKLESFADGSVTAVWAGEDPMTASRPQGGIFGPSVPVSVGHGARGLDTGVGRDGTLVVTWSDGTDDSGRVWASVREPGLPFGSAQPVSDVADIESLLVAIGADGTATIAWGEGSQNFNAIHSSVRDAGGTFGPPELVPGTYPSFGPEELLVTDDGTALMTWRAWNGGSIPLSLNEKPPDGPFGQPTLISPGGPPHDVRLASEPHGLSVAIWIQPTDSGNRIRTTSRFERSHDFKDTQTISTADEFAADLQMSSGAGNSETVAWTSTSGERPSRIALSTHFPGGHPERPPRWKRANDLASPTVDYSRPQVAAGPGDRMAVGWHASRGEAEWLMASSKRGTNPLERPRMIPGSDRSPEGLRMSLLNSGTAVAVWSASRGGHRVIKASMSPPGKPFGQARVISNPRKDSVDPDVSGGFIVWRGGNGVKLSKLRPSGRFSPASTLARGASASSKPRISTAPGRAANVVWTSPVAGRNVVNYAFVPQGGPARKPVTLSTGNGGSAEAMVSTGLDGTVTAVWKQETADGARVMAATRKPGNPFSRPRMISSRAPTEAPQVSVGAYGASTAAWQSEKRIEGARTIGNPRKR